MEIPAGTPVEAITIGGTPGIEVPLPYNAGHVCTDGEATVLNQTLKENARNNLRERVKKEADGNKEAAQALFQAWINEYEFGNRAGGGFRSTDPLEKERMDIARRAIRAAYLRQGTKAAEIVASDVTTKAKALLADPTHGPEITKRAKAALKRYEKDAEDLAGIL